MFADIDHLTMGATVISLNTRRPESAAKSQHLLQKLGVILRTQTTSVSMITIYSVKFDFVFRSNFWLLIPSFLVHIWNTKQ